MPIDFHFAQAGERRSLSGFWMMKWWYRQFIVCDTWFQVNALLQVALHEDGFVDDALVMVATHNKCIEFMEKFNFGGAAQICSIFYTTIFSPPSRIDVKDILQVHCISPFFATFIFSNMSFIPHS